MNVSPVPQPTQILAPVLRIELVAARYFLMTLLAPTIALRAKAGQFVHLLGRDSSQRDPLLRRAFSILAARPQLPSACQTSPAAVEHETGCGEIDILFRVEGAATSQLSHKRKGEFVDMIGPLGRPFDLDLFHVKHEASEKQKRPILVGGGVGVPPLIFLGDTLRQQGAAPLMLLGARHADEIIGRTHFRELQIETQIATDDGSFGLHGRVTDLLEVALRNDAQAVIYACGPLAMLKAVAKMAENYRAPCQVSLEENMPCGIGVCNGCVVPMKTRADPQLKVGELEAGKSDYERYQRVCVNGPAMWSHQVDWEAL